MIEERMCFFLGEIIDKDQTEKKVEYYELEMIIILTVDGMILSTVI